MCGGGGVGWFGSGGGWLARVLHHGNSAGFLAFTANAVRSPITARAVSSFGRTEPDDILRRDRKVERRVLEKSLLNVQKLQSIGRVSEKCLLATPFKRPLPVWDQTPECRSGPSGGPPSMGAFPRRDPLRTLPWSQRNAPPHSLTGDTSRL